jgi:hypothetical protein
MRIKMKAPEILGEIARRRHNPRWRTLAMIDDEVATLAIQVHGGDLSPAVDWFMSQHIPPYRLMGMRLETKEKAEAMWMLRQVGRELLANENHSDT